MKVFSILGSRLGSPHLGKLPNQERRILLLIMGDHVTGLLVRSCTQHFAKVQGGIAQFGSGHLPLELCISTTSV